MIYSNGNNIIQSGETLRLWAFLTDVNGNALSNQEVVFYTVKNTVKTQIGSPVTTNTNGIAICDYVGSGMGDIAIMAETEIEGMILQETYTVWDTVKFDNGTIASHNDIWNYDPSTTVLTRYDKYSSITEKVSGTDARLYCKNLPTSAVVEIELCQIDGTVGEGGLNFYDNTSYITYFNLGNLGYSSSILGQWVRLRITYGNGSLTVVSLDDPTKTVTKTYNNNITAISPSTNDGITEHRFRNLRVYNV